MKTAFLHHLRRPLLFLWTLLIFGVSMPGSAYGQGKIEKIRLTREPSNEFTKTPVNEVTIIWACYVLFSGRPLNCTFTQEIVGLADRADSNGGHFHNGTRPLVFDPPGKLEYVADEEPGNPFLVKGNTLATPPNNGAIITHKVPQAGGIIAIKGEMRVPGGWHCAAFCFDRESWRAEGTVDVRVPGLTQLLNPGPDDLYVKLRDGPSGPGTDAPHTDSVAFAASAFTQQALPLLAENYFVLSGRILSVNDMSLPKGGVFDIANNWTKDHKEHRNGNDADINRAGIQCEDDRALRLAIDQLLVGVERKNGEITALLCEETTGFKHIDFTTFP